MAPITTIYAALLALLVITLAAFVVRGRLGQKIELGAGATGELELAIRAHGNLVEYAPIFLILLLVAELGGMPGGWLHGIGAAFVVARIMHAAGLSRTRGASFGRYWGTVLTWLLIIGLALALLVRTLLAH